MKITLTFLLLGISLALTNGFILSNKKNNKKKMSESEAYSFGRMISLVMRRWNDWQNCHKCSDVERYCMEKAIVEDSIFIMRLLANDMGQKMSELVINVDFRIHVTYIYNAVDTGDVETLTKLLRGNGLINHFVSTTVGLLNKPLHDCNVELGSMLNAVNEIVGGSLGASLGIVGGLTGAFGDLLGGLTGAAGGIVGTATDLVGGALGTATGVVGGALGTATDLVGNTVGAATGALGGLTKSFGGLTKNLKLG